MNPTDLLAAPGPALAPEVEAEISNIAAEIARFERGELSPERFRSFRLAHGIYGQRQPGVQMVRVKIPGGVVSGRQLEALAEASREFANGISHLTTRQDVQFHYVQLRRVPELLRFLAAAGFTTREACGNSVRNVTACPLTGFLADELFDVQPYAQALYAYLVRNPFCQQMARKFKIAFSACPEDCASTAIHDIGFVARVRETGGRLHYGFQVLVGGGLGTTPFVAQVLDPFVSAEEILPLTKAVLKVFNAHGNRRNKMRARLKYVVHNLGIEAFRGEVKLALAELTDEEIREANLRLHVPDRYRAEFDARRNGPRVNGTDSVAAPSNAPRLEDPLVIGPSADDEYIAWTSGSVRRHRDPGHAIVTILVPLGDLDAPKLSALGSLVTAFGGGEARIAVNQNLVLPNVRRADLAALFTALRKNSLAEFGAGSAIDVTSCPGADTCALGITSSKGLTRALRSSLTRLAAEEGLDGLTDITIKVSGCPNSCGHHHVASIGFHGIAHKIGGRPAPGYQLHLGGRIENGRAVIGRPVVKLAARNVPEIVEHLLRDYRRGRKAGERFVDYVDRTPDEWFKSVIRPVMSVSAGAAFIDWGQTVEFTTDEIGSGECAGAGLDAVTEPFDNFDAEIRQGRLFVERGQWVDSLANLGRSRFTLARVLLEKIGKKPDSDYEVRCELRARIIDRGLMDETWNEIDSHVEELLKTRTPDPERIRRGYKLAHKLRSDAAGAWLRLETAGASAAADLPA